MNARDELAEVVSQALADVTGIFDTSTEEDKGMADHILAAGYSKPKVIGYAVLDRAGHMIGEQFTERNAAFEFAAEWTKDCEDAGIDWDYRVATITEAAA